MQYSPRNRNSYYYYHDYNDNNIPSLQPRYIPPHPSRPPQKTLLPRLPEIHLPRRSSPAPRARVFCVGTDMVLRCRHPHRAGGLFPDRNVR